MAQDPIHDKLDILVYSIIDAREENARFQRSIRRTQWVTCSIVVGVVLIAAIVICRSMPA